MNCLAVRLEKMCGVPGADDGVAIVFVTIEDGFRWTGDSPLGSFSPGE